MQCDIHIYSCSGLANWGGRVNWHIHNHSIHCGVCKIGCGDFFIIDFIHSYENKISNIIRDKIIGYQNKCIHAFNKSIKFCKSTLQNCIKLYWYNASFYKLYCVYIVLLIKDHMHVHNNYASYNTHILEPALLCIPCSVGVQAGVNLVVVQYKTMHPQEWALNHIYLFLWIYTISTFQTYCRL